MKCKYCNRTKGLETLGVTGKYKKDWTYCEDHHDEAFKDRDKFLVEKIGKDYDSVITPPIFEGEKLHAVD